MPCSDVTDYLELNLDTQDRLKSYRMEKLSCGKSVGGAVLQPFIQDHSAEDLLLASIERLAPEFETYAAERQFLLYKQLFTLQAALSAYLGKDAGYAVNAFEVRSIQTDETGTSISGYLAIDYVQVERIKSCGHCGCRKK